MLTAFSSRKIKTEDIEGIESVSEASSSSQETHNESSKKDEETKKKEAEQANLKDSKGYLLFYTLVKLVIEITNILLRLICVDYLYMCTCIYVSFAGVLELIIYSPEF